MNKPVLFIYGKMKEDDKVSRAKNPKYESMSLEELKANMEKSRQELEAAIHHKVMNQMRNSSYNKSVVRQTYISASQKTDKRLPKQFKRQRREMTVNGKKSLTWRMKCLK